VIVNKKAKIRNAVVDKGCVIPEGMEIGFDPVADKQRFEVSPNGIVLVTPDMLGQRLHMVR